MNKALAKEILPFLDADKELVAIAGEFKILSLIEWPKNTQENFIAGYKKGRAQLPEITYPKHDFAIALARLDKIIRETEDLHPIAQFINQTAKSYHAAHRLVENLGTKEMLKCSLEIYGRPSDLVAGSKYTGLDAAKFFVEIADQFDEYYSTADDDMCILAETIKDQLETAIKEVITDDKVNVFVDENLVPKAAAGVTRIRLRSGTCFSKYDFKQLLEHEVFVHTLTAINGRHQKLLTCLALGAPRTTATQEGLATFAELITGAIDMNRLKRIALRVIGVEMALQGANFIEVFEFFKQKNQSDSESFSSTQRIFRGANVSGGAAFTKDSVYLDGLLRAHSFFRWAMKNLKLDLSRVLFTGRMAFDDAEKLAPFMMSTVAGNADTAIISPPKYLPPWLAQVPTLGGYLAFSLFANKIRVGGLDKEFGAS